MNSRDYWERRAAQDMYDRMGTAEETAAEMNAAINQTSAYLEKEVKAVMRGMQSFGISEAEAKKILNAAGDGTALQRLRKAAQQVGDPEKREALLNAINSAGAYRYRITRLEELNKDIVKQCRELYKTENRHITSALRNVAEDSYYHEIFNIQKGTGLGFSFSKFPRQDVDRILRSNWSGGNYSQRIWKDVNGMTARLKDELLVSMLSGRSNEKTARIFQEQFGVNAFCARRIVRTESAYVANAAQMSAYNEAGVEKYRFIATLDSKTSEVCAALDGKVFAAKDAKPGTNYPPMHPFCRSTTIADFGDDELEGLERRAKDKDGNTVKVPAGMTYEEWHRKFVEGEKTLDKSAKSAIIKSDEKLSELGKFKEKIRLDDRMSNEYYRAAKDKFSHGTDNAKAVFNKYVSTESVADSEYSGISHYDPNGKKIYMNYAMDLNNERGACATWFHEHGHLIDDMAGKISDDSDFRKALDDDYLSYMKQYGKANGLKTFGKVQSAIGKDLSNMREHSAVSDLLNGLSKGNIVGIASHSPEYWSDDSVYCSEAFAHMFEAQFDKVRYAEMKKYFPTALKKFEDMLGGLA